MNLFEVFGFCPWIDLLNTRMTSVTQSDVLFTLG